ncbi:hypothetical protein [Methylobacterium haplocladii]|uniref:Uncharacterized protein n=1 Tax=Methylobacterium haplocladii TaxID=1176176 RepID=A0A512ILZ2_9HYPH|nr:hypothetical protein [Methylobacterium haplocladii]GEO98695.1 hypothetical protein MHA02_10830 [Methylobacterium haplocladii]GLS57655.1 hypothetical protein GCM10007887_03110 [Methylobacterium haplocladii]
MDRGRKTACVRTVPSLQTVLILCQDATRVEVWRRETWWAMQRLGPGDDIEFPGRGGTLHVTDVYARVTF